MEGVTELIERFFLIRSVYIKVTIPLFITAVLINSGLLLFIPGLHYLQYPTLAMLFTILAYITGLSIGIIFGRYENKIFKPHDSTIVIIISTTFITSIIYACAIIQLYQPIMSLVEYFLLCLKSISINTGTFVIIAGVRYWWGTK